MVHAAVFVALNQKVIYVPVGHTSLAPPPVVLEAETNVALEVANVVAEATTNAEGITAGAEVVVVPAV